MGGITLNNAPLGSCISSAACNGISKFFFWLVEIIQIQNRIRIHVAARCLCMASSARSNGKGKTKGSAYLEVEVNVAHLNAVKLKRASFEHLSASKYMAMHEVHTLPSRTEQSDYQLLSVYTGNRRPTAPDADAEGASKEPYEAVSDYRFSSIVSFLACCWPLSIIAMAYSRAAHRAEVMGRLKRAANYSRKASIWILLAVGFGFVSLVVLVIVMRKCLLPMHYCIRQATDNLQ